MIKTWPEDGKWGDEETITNLVSENLLSEKLANILLGRGKKRDLFLYQPENIMQMKLLPVNSGQITIKGKVMTLYPIKDYYKGTGEVAYMQRFIFQDHKDQISVIIWGLPSLDIQTVTATKNYTLNHCVIREGYQNPEQRELHIYYSEIYNDFFNEIIE